MKTVFFSSLLRIFTNVVLLLYYSYIWHVEKFNAFAFYWSVGLITASLFDFGCTTRILVGDYSRDRVAKYFGVKLFLTIILLVLTILGSSFFNYIWIPLLLLTLHCQTYFDFLGAKLKKQGQYKKDFFVVVISYVPFLLVGFFFSGLDLLVLCSLWLSFRVIGVVLCAYLFLSDVRGSGCFNYVSGSVGNLRHNWQYFVEGFLAVVAVNIDVVLLGVVLSQQSFYSYSIFNKYLLGVNFFVFVFSQFFYSKYTSYTPFRNIIMEAGRYYLVVAVVGAASVLFLFSSDFVSKMLSGFYLGTATLSILASTLLFRVLSAFLAVPVVLGGLIKEKNLYSFMSLAMFLVTLFLVRKSDYMWVLVLPLLISSLFMFFAYLALCVRVKNELRWCR